MLKEALLLAKQGFCVFPCHSIVPLINTCDCYKPTCSKPGKHPHINKWPERASTDPTVIRKWWKQWPDANIAVVGGDGLVIIDVDPRHGGSETLAALESEVGPIPRDWSVKTGGGGLHIYLATDQGLRFSNAKNWRPGIDIRSFNGYAIAPPSVHESGNQYAWFPRTGEHPPTCPATLLAVLPIYIEPTKTRRKPKSVDPPAEYEKQTANRKQATVEPDNGVTEGGVSTDKTDTPDNPNNYSVVSELSGLSVETETKTLIWAAVIQTLPTDEGMRNDRLIRLGRRLLLISEVRDWDAEQFEPVIKLWLRLAIEQIGPREWGETWMEWVYIWGVWLDRSGAFEKVRKAFELAMSRPFPPMPESYRSVHLRQLVALCAAMHETACDSNGIWFVSTRDAATVIGLVINRNGTIEPMHELVASFFRRMVTDGILQRICHHCGGANTIRKETIDGKQKRICSACGKTLTGSLKAQRYRYVGWQAEEASTAA